MNFIDQSKNCFTQSLVIELIQENPNDISITQAICLLHFIMNHRLIENIRYQLTEEGVKSFSHKELCAYLDHLKVKFKNRGNGFDSGDGGSCA